MAPLYRHIQSISAASRRLGDNSDLYELMSVKLISDQRSI